MPKYARVSATVAVGIVYVADPNIDAVPLELPELTKPDVIVPSMLSLALTLAVTIPVELSNDIVGLAVTEILDIETLPGVTLIVRSMSLFKYRPSVSICITVPDCLSITTVALQVLPSII